MIDTLKIDAFLNARANKPGVSRPALIAATDGNTYFLKGHFGTFKDGLTKLDAALAQEAFCYSLAKFLKIPTPDFVFIEVTNDDLSDFPQLRFENNITQAGIYLGIKEVKNLLTDELKLLLRELDYGAPGAQNKLNKLVAQISNKHDVPKILYFDCLTANVDKYRNFDNILLYRSNNGKTLLSIDFGYCFFGPYWNTREYYTTPGFEKIKLLQNNNPDNMWYGILLNSLGNNTILTETPVFKLLERLIDCKNSSNPFREIYSSTKLLNAANLTTMLNYIPNEWFVGGTYQRNMYLQFILNQVDNLPVFFDYLVSQNCFTNISGGGLVWQDKNILSR
ncbi:protein kinase family protein [Ligilactobacillus murinus]|uniref:hypothetical protein n=1 Tax=Ligilactobacillus murinus TaxID=1622 RepID=UPI0010942D1B|nr:hypothetical protein [Ligilactobacillus murinus]TGY52351.1 hypothetical protein E5341_06720 [Ligilactobacillus murinus]